MAALRERRDDTGVRMYLHAREQLASLLVKEEQFWRQRAKTTWLREGDLNTKFFHACATTRKKKNRIEKLLDSDGNHTTSREGLCRVVAAYFEALFGERRGHYQPVLDVIQPRITPDDNARLLRPFSEEEFNCALHQMDPDKAPGPDGFNPGFYRRFWGLTGRDIFQACCQWVEQGYFSASLNETNIALIPKTDRPTAMTELRPISLCNVLYKVLSKVLANRLKEVLPRCISEEQSIFVPGRSILDNAIMAIEVLHHMKGKRHGTYGDLALKIDIGKAYDSVDWGFLTGTMLAMGFDSRWVQWMRMCIASMSYKVVVNNDRVGPIQPGRGLR